MFDIEIKRSFAAAHFLRGYNGPCRNMHGHNYSVCATVRCKDTDELGLALDFTILKKAVDQVICNLDHSLLNDQEPFKEVNPTSENMARYIYLALSKMINNEAVKVVKVRIGESENSAVTYFEI
jgi:6-pyruvoyltetrahydropterin/6-carboxytetrahydropterin synthase